MRPHRPEGIHAAFGCYVKGFMKCKGYFNPSHLAADTVRDRDRERTTQREGEREREKERLVARSLVVHQIASDKNLAVCPEKKKTHMSTFNCQTDHNNSSVI